jgi:hypothetical protein
LVDWNIQLRVDFVYMDSGESITLSRRDLFKFAGKTAVGEVAKKIPIKSEVSPPKESKEDEKRIEDQADNGEIAKQGDKKISRREFNRWIAILVGSGGVLLSQLACGNCADDDWECQAKAAEKAAKDAIEKEKRAIEREQKANERRLNRLTNQAGEAGSGARKIISFPKKAKESDPIEFMADVGQSNVGGSGEQGGLGSELLKPLTDVLQGE